MKTYSILTSLNIGFLIGVIVVMTNIAHDLRTEIIYSRAKLDSSTRDLRAETHALSRACIVAANEFTGRWPRVAE